mmetsp:Transcript_39644/g.66135  ORF Transcript_39644/g.66135 Transcript_39644/m.66135 type:complete len:101 (+) Transcript_39644:80-382(+)
MTTMKMMLINMASSTPQQLEMNSMKKSRSRKVKMKNLERRKERKRKRPINNTILNIINSLSPTTNQEATRKNHMQTPMPTQRHITQEEEEEEEDWCTSLR